MANTFTSNYNIIKSEIGGDNQSWGENLHTTLNSADIALGKKLEDQLFSGITSTAILLRKDDATNTISTDANLKYFESVQIGDRIRNSAAASATNGTAANPVIHTVIAKTSADSITVASSPGLVKDIASSHTIAKVIEPVHINSGPIVCAPLTSLSQTTRAVSGCVGQPGTDATHALVANGDVTLGSSTSADTVTFTSKIATNFIPSVNETYDLGAATTGKWDNAHIKTGNIDSLIAPTVDINGGTVDGITSLSVSATTISMTGYTIGSNASNNRTVSTSAAADGENGDIHYEY